METPKEERVCYMLDLAEFETYLRSEDRSNNTIGCYLRDTKAFIGWYSSRTESGLDKLIELDAVEYKKYLLNTSTSVVTANRKMASVNALCKWLHSISELVKQNCNTLVEIENKILVTTAQNPC